MQERLQFTTVVPANANYPENCCSISSVYANQTQTGRSAGCMLGGVFEHELFSIYDQLYTQFRIEGMKVNFAVTNPIGSGGDFSNLSVYCSIERETTGDDYQASYDPSNPTAPHYPLPYELVHAANTPVAMAVNNSITRFQRQVWASDLMERCNYADVGTRLVTRTINGEVNMSMRELYGNNPFFSPTLFFTVGTSDVRSSQRVVNILCDITYYVAFRNPKYAAGMDSVSKGASRILPPAGGADAVIDMDGQDDMDDGGDGGDGPPETRSGRILGAAALGGAAVVGAAAANRALRAERSMEGNNATQGGLLHEGPPRRQRGDMDDDGSVRSAIRTAWNVSGSGRHPRILARPSVVLEDPDAPPSEN